MGKKVYLSQAFVDALNKEALDRGKSQEWFDSWVKQWVVIYDVLEE